MTVTKTPTENYQQILHINHPHIEQTECLGELTRQMMTTQSQTTSFCKEAITQNMIQMNHQSLKNFKQDTNGTPVHQKNQMMTQMTVTMRKINKHHIKIILKNVLKISN